MSQTEPPDGVPNADGPPSTDEPSGADGPPSDVPATAPPPAAAEPPPLAAAAPLAVEADVPPATSGWPGAATPSATPLAEPTTAPQTVDVAPADPGAGFGGTAAAGEPGTAEPGWVGPTAEPAKGRSLIKKLAIPVVILVVVVGAVVFRDRLSGSSSDLVVGDCFDAPSSASAPTSGVEVGDVQHHPCSEAHGFEVFAVLKHPAAKGDPYPGTETLFTYADTNCLPPFATYVGIEFAESTLGAGSIVPQQKGWESGERTITCYVGNPDELPVTGSLKGAKR